MDSQIILKTHFLETELGYDGSQLRSHFAFENFGIQGDAIVSFIGPCDVDIKSMVDLEDVARKQPIFSNSMLHFIIEHFDDDLTRMILKQRLLMSLMQEELHDSIEELKVVRRGDDLYWNEFKLSVSIATKSLISTLVHAAININSEGTPLPTKGLSDFGLNPQAFARSVMNRYVAELTGVAWARAKVKPVP